MRRTEAGTVSQTVQNVPWPVTMMTGVAIGIVAAFMFAVVLMALNPACH